MWDVKKRNELLGCFETFYKKLQASHKEGITDDKESQVEVQNLVMEYSTSVVETKESSTGEVHSVDNNDLQKPTWREEILYKRKEREVQQMKFEMKLKEQLTTVIKRTEMVKMKVIVSNEICVIQKIRTDEMLLVTETTVE